MLQIKGQKEGAIANVELLKRLDELERLLLQKPYVGYVSHYGDILKTSTPFGQRLQGRKFLQPTSWPMCTWKCLFPRGDPEDTRSFFTMDYSRANMLILFKRPAEQASR